MAIQSGVLRARPDGDQREDNASTPHLQVRALDDSSQPWRIAVNVQSDGGSNVAFWVVDPLAGHPLLASLTTTASGFSTIRAQCGPRARLHQGASVLMEGRSIAASIRQREQRRPARPPVLVSRPVQGCPRRDLRIRREIQSEPPQTNRCRVGQHGWSPPGFTTST